VDILKKLILFLVPLVLFAHIIGLQELIETLFPLLLHRSPIKIYTIPRYYYLFDDNETFLLVKECNESDLVFGDINCSKPTFGLSYQFYHSHPNVIGAFYYRKGRPQLIIKLQSYKKYFGPLSPELKRFAQ